MKIKLIKSYPKLEDGKRKLDDNGNPIIVFMYRVTGTKEELEEYLHAQKEQDLDPAKFKDDKGILWFTTNPVDVRGVLKISTNGHVHADTTAIDLAVVMTRNYGVVGRDMARELLKQELEEEETEESKL